MKRYFASAMGLLIVALIVVGCGHYLASHGWVTLIDGETGMDNWNPTGSAANWRAAEGAIQADKSTTKGSSVLVSKKSFKDFELYVEFWAADDTNSGIYIRAKDPTNVSTSTGAYEAQIWDKNPNPAYSTGSLVNVAAVNPIYKAGGRWNTYEIYAKGPQITVKLNGVVTVSAQDGRFPEGRIGIQYNGGPIKVRKLLVREL
jgi:3-keto-disaccharide hydrolase